MRRALLALALFLTPVAASAEDAASISKRAREAYERKDYDEALKLMRKAYELDPAPVLLNNIAVAHKELGHYREAHDLFLRVVTTSELPDSTRKRAEERLAELKQKLASPWLRVRIGADESARVDGKPWRQTEEAIVLPGEHIVEVRDLDGRRIRVERVYSVAGRRHDVPSRPTVERSFSTLTMNCPTEIISLEIDRMEIGLPVASDARIEIQKGNYAVRLDCRDRARYEARLDATAAEVRVPPMRLEALPEVVQVAPAPGPPSPWPPVAVGGAGVVAMAVAAGLLVSASADADDLEVMAPDPGRATITYAAALEIDDRRRFKSDAGVVVMSVGIAAAVGGAVWYLLQ